MSEIEIKADEAGGPEMYVGENLIGTPMLSLRDYFAAQVIHLTMEKGPSYSELRALFGDDYGSVPFSKTAATRAYLIADAMLEARKVKK